MNGQLDPLQAEIARRTARGWQVVYRHADEAQLRRPKHFSFVCAFLWFLLFGVGILVYLLWHWAKRDELIFLRVENGQVRTMGERRHFWRTLAAPFLWYWHWASRREWPLGKSLAYGGPVIAIIVLLIIIGAVAGGGGEEDQTAAPDATAQPPKVTNEAPLAVGSVAELGDSVRVRVDRIIDPCILESTLFQELEPGTHMVVYQFTFENLANEGQTILGGFSAKDRTGFEYDSTFATCKGEQDLPLCFLEDLVTTMACEEAFEVREGQEVVELRYDPNPFTTKDIVFKAAQAPLPEPTATPQAVAPAERGYQVLGSSGPHTYRLLVEGTQVDLTVESMVNSHIRQIVRLAVDGRELDRLPRPDFSQFLGVPGTTADYMSGQVEVLFGDDVQIDVVYPLFQESDPFCCPTGGRIHQVWRVRPVGFELVLEERVSE